MKKIFSTVLILLLLSSCAYAETIGIIRRLKFSEDELKTMSKNDYENNAIDFVFENGKTFNDLNYRFYDSLNTMQLALNAGEIDAMNLLDAVGDFVLASNPNYKIKGITTLRGSQKMVLAFGFLKNSSFLQNEFNKALQAISNDGTLGRLIMNHIYSAGAQNPVKVSFKNFKDASTVRVAITGDLPPIDYVAADGTPAGFNVAVLAEVANKLKINVEIIQVESAARVSALTSGRADCIFWFEGRITDEKLMPMYDAPEDLIFSQPYYNFKKVVYVGLK